MEKENKILILFAHPAIQKSRINKKLIDAIDDKSKILDIVHLAKRKYPHLKMYTRAITMKNTFQLMERNIPNVTGRCLNLP